MGNIIEFFMKVILLGFLISSVVHGANAAENVGRPSPGTTYVAGNKSLVDPLRLYDQLIDETLKPKNGIAVTEACKPGEEWRPVEIPDGVYHMLIPDTSSTTRSRLGVFAVDRSVDCIRVGYPVRLVVRKGADGLYGDAGWFMPTGLVAAPASPTSLHISIARTAGLAGAMAQTVFVSGRIIHSESLLTHRLDDAPKIDGVLAITREQIESAIQAQNFILDVRSEKEFAVSRIKGAVNIPFRLGRLELGQEIYTTRGDQFDLQKVTAAKDQPVVVVGTDYHDLRPKRAALLLAKKGYRRVYFFFEGMAYFDNMISFPPTMSKQVTVISAIRLRQLMADLTLKPELIDVRSRIDFAVGAIGFPSGTWSSPYQEAEDFQFRRRGLSGEILTTVGDRFVIPNSIPKSGHVIVIGYDRRDFLPYKAALVLKASGFTNVYWCREGVAMWKQLGNEHIAGFPILELPELASSTEAVVKMQTQAAVPGAIVAPRAAPSSGTVAPVPPKENQQK